LERQTIRIGVNESARQDQGEDMMSWQVKCQQACRREGVDLTGLLGELKQLAEGDGVNPARLVSITRTHQPQQI
jgi:hypothetical protein